MDGRNFVKSLTLYGLKEVIDYRILVFISNFFTIYPSGKRVIKRSLTVSPANIIQSKLVIRELSFQYLLSFNAFSNLPQKVFSIAFSTWCIFNVLYMLLIFELQLILSG